MVDLLRRPFSHPAGSREPRLDSVDGRAGLGDWIVPDPGVDGKGLLATNNGEDSEVRIGEKAGGYSGNAGDGPQMEQWITSPTGRSWKITLIAGG